MGIADWLVAAAAAIRHCCAGALRLSAGAGCPARGLPVPRTFPAAERGTAGADGDADAVAAADRQPRLGPVAGAGAGRCLVAAVAALANAAGGMAARTGRAGAGRSTATARPVALHRWLAAAVCCARQRGAAVPRPVVRHAGTAAAGGWSAALAIQQRATGLGWRRVAVTVALCRPVRRRPARDVPSADAASPRNRWICRPDRSR